MVACLPGGCGLYIGLLTVERCDLAGLSSLFERGKGERSFSTSVLEVVLFCSSCVCFFKHTSLHAVGRLDVERKDDDGALVFCFCWREIIVKCPPGSIRSFYAHKETAVGHFVRQVNAADFFLLLYIL